jgi:iron(III) transport system ATP-binding protein
MSKATARVLGAAGITAILVTHDQAEALSFADQVAVLRAGRVAQVGRPKELYLRPRDRGTALFLGDAIVLPAELGDGWAECRLGRVAACTADRRGAAEIMLRPEQLQLTPVSPDIVARGGDPGACYGQVTEVEFGGAVCTVAVALATAADHPFQDPVDAAARDAPLLIRSSSVDLPPVGTHVRIAVLGRSHVFDHTATEGPDGAI